MPIFKGNKTLIPMFESVSVDQALARGKRMVSYPLIFILFLPIVAAFIWVVVADANGWFLAAAFILGFALAWLYWSVTITKWRLWAFDNVRNVHELKMRAIKDNLIGADGGFFEKTELISATQKEKWAALQYKFKQADIFHDDVSISVETVIRYSKVNATGFMLFGFAMAGVAAYLFTQENVQAVAWVLTMVGLPAIFWGCRRLVNRNPQITLGDDGITLADNDFYSWEDVTGEDTRIVHYGKNTTTYFVFTLAGDEAKIDIGPLDIKVHQFEKLLRTYRGRFNEKSLS